MFTSSINVDCKPSSILGWRRFSRLSVTNKFMIQWLTFWWWNNNIATIFRWGLPLLMAVHLDLPVLCHSCSCSSTNSSYRIYPVFMPAIVWRVNYSSVLCILVQHFGRYSISLLYNWPTLFSHHTYSWWCLIFIVAFCIFRSITSCMQVVAGNTLQAIYTHYLTFLHSWFL